MNQKTIDVISSACERMNLSFEDHAAEMQVMIYECLITMYSTKNMSLYKKGTIEVVDCKAFLPDNCVELTRIFTSATCHLCPGVDYVTQNNLVIFSTGLNIEDGTEYTIQYKALSEDEEGNLDFDFRWSRMLIAYICWKMCLKYPNNYPQFVMMEHKREYINQKTINR